MRYGPVIFVVLLTALCVVGVDRNNFKTCQQSSFCRRCRQMERGKSTFELVPDSTQITQSSIQSEIVDTKYNVKFSLAIFAVDGGIFRVKINEIKPLSPRFEVPHVLVAEPSLQGIKVESQSSSELIVSSGGNKVHVQTKPFRIDFYSGDDLVASANQNGLLRFEFLRQKPQPKEVTDGEEAPTESVEVVEAEFTQEQGAWEENFKSHHDNKPRGPSAVALDFTFPGAKAAYGLAEHADSLSLKTTKNMDPYRLYNLDVFEYELDNPMALYASIPLLYAHSAQKTVGVFWLNAAETWVDIVRSSDENVISSLVNLVSGSKAEPHVDAHFMSETGIIDVFVLLGPSADDVAKQYATLTGTAPLPQMFSLGYHQSRWNYNDQDDVKNVADGFDQHDMPMDVMWLDIEYTDNKKYFTWDPIRFSDPLAMNKNLTAKGRKLVAIIDSHYKRDGSYFLHNEAEANGYYCKTSEGKDYEGWCWPGSSSYLDLLNPVVRDYLSSQYMLDKWKGSTLDTHIWNDMNEPSVFNGPEVTMPKDIVHVGGIEHRELHNMYGFLYTMSTFDGLLRRSEGRLRPFILTRSAFPGSQRHAAIWTGDNAAEWDHLRISIPMCLSLSLGGMAGCGADIGGFFKNPDPELFARWYQTGGNAADWDHLRISIPLCLSLSFGGMVACGADIGGFFKNPDPELFARWYQVGAFQGFYRAHSHIDTKRREPWSMGDTTTDVIRAALRKRYSYLPFWYTLFAEHERSSSFVMRPLFTEFPDDEEVFGIDNEYLLGRSLLVHPVQEAGAKQVSVYFPGKNEVWYDVDTFQKYQQEGYVQIPVDLYKIPVFQRGGHIIPKKERIRRSSPLMRDDPYTLIVAIDTKGYATGTLYIDDEETYEYRQGKYLYLRFTYENGKLTASYEDPAGKFETKAWLERVVIIGVPKAISGAEIQVAGEAPSKLATSYVAEKQLVVVRKPGVNMGKQWSISLF